MIFIYKTKGIIIKGLAVMFVSGIPAARLLFSKFTRSAATDQYHEVSKAAEHWLARQSVAHIDRNLVGSYSQSLATLWLCFQAHLVL